MLPFWVHTPPQGERTHKWDVSETDWSTLPRLKGTALQSKEFECGGVAGLSLMFYPHGIGRDGDSAKVVLHAANGVELMVYCKFTVEFSDRSKCVSTTTYLQNFPADGNYFKSSPAYRSITVELKEVSKKCQQQDTHQINFVHGEMLRVTLYPRTAEESFGVVGCKHSMKVPMEAYLGKIGCVVRVEQCVVELKHDDDTLVRWGKGALSKLLTSDEVEGMKVPQLQEHLRNRGLSVTGRKDELIKRLKEVEKCGTVAHDKGNGAPAQPVASSSATGDTTRTPSTVKKRAREEPREETAPQNSSDPGKTTPPKVGMKVKITSTILGVPRAIGSTIGDTSSTPSKLEKRPRRETREETDPQNSSDHKRPRMCNIEFPQDQVVVFFPLETSEMIVRCGQRQAGGGGEGSNTLNVRAGEIFKVAVTIKSRFGTVGGGQLVEQMMQEIVILPEREVELQGKPHFSTATGVATFPVSIRKAGNLEISAAVSYKGEHCTIGGRGVVIKVGPGAMKLKQLLVKEEAELGEEVELVVVPDSTDLFGNDCQLPRGEKLLSSFADLRLKCCWSHEGHVPVNLPLMKPSLTEIEDGVLVCVLNLRLLGLHTFQIRYSTQVLKAQVRIVCGMPHSLRYEAYSQPHVLLHRRWGCKAQVLNVQGQEMKIREEDFTVKLLNTENGLSLPLKVCSTPRIEFVQGCSLVNHIDSENEVTDFEIVLSETENPAHRGTYKLHAYAAGMSLCMHAEIRLDEPIDPATWSSQDLAENLRQARFEVQGSTGDVLKDEFGDELSGRNLIGKVDEKYETLKDCLLHDKKFSDREEKAHVCGLIKDYVKSLNERHTVFGLGKGEYPLADFISEKDDLVLDPEPFDEGGTAKIFRGEYQGSLVAVKIPLVKEVGLKFEDDTVAMLQEVERELATTKNCSHQNVVQIHGLMVGPRRFGIVMEYCDMSLAKYIQNRDKNRETPLLGMRVVINGLVAKPELNGRSGTAVRFDDDNGRYSVALDDTSSFMIKPCNLRVDTLEPVDWGEAVRFLLDASTGLAFIHKHRRTTHGDVKPDNLLIQQGRIKVSDFGLATVHRTMTKLTGQVPRKGTSFFMAPEMLLGNDPNAAKAAPIDVWGFGCVIANVVTGKIPYVSVKSQVELEAAMRLKTPVYLKENLLAMAPKMLVDLIDKCCQHEPRQRPNMEEIERELRGILKSIQTKDGFALPPPWLERGCSLDDSSWEMKPCDASSMDFKIIKSRLESEMGEHVTLLKVEMNANVDLFRCYHAERHRISKENGGDANEMWMWHATQSSRSKEDNILKKGLDTNFCGLDFEYYGAGIYLAPDSKLSNDYAASSRNTQYPSNRSMLLVRIACGKVFDKRHPLNLHPEFQDWIRLQSQKNLTNDQKKKQEKDKYRELLRKPENRMPPSEMHSQLGDDISGGRKSRTELIINRSCQAFPAYRISYGLARALPKALSKEGQANLRTLDDLKSSEFNQKAVSFM